MNDLYKGAIIEEGLLDNRIMNDFEITGVDITYDDDPAERWHIYSVLVAKEKIYELAKHMKPTGYYAHFWGWNDMFVVFPGKVFEMNRQDRTTWTDAIDHGLKIDIPIEQLNFLTD